MHYQHIVVSGTPYERGYSHGTQARSKIHTSIHHYKSSPLLGPYEHCLRHINESYIPATQAIFPDGLDEMRGIACGAGVDLEDIVLLNARYDLSRINGEKVEECTSMAYLGPNGTSFVAQNWDNSSWLLDTIIVLESHLNVPEMPLNSSPTSTSPRVIIALTEAGQLARSGMNSLGLALCANSLWCSEDRSPTKPSLPFTLARTMYLHCTNFAAGLKVLSTFPRHVSGNLMVGCSEMAMDLELTPTRKFVVHPETHIFRSPGGQSTQYSLITHANHFQTLAMNLPLPLAALDTYSGGSSLFRDRRLRLLLETSLQQQTRQLMPSSGLSAVPVELEIAKGVSPPTTPSEEQAKSGVAFAGSEMPSSVEHQTTNLNLAVADIKAAFSDHASFPQSLCEHTSNITERYGAESSRTTMTVACVIYDLGRGEMHVSAGNPCQGTAFWSRYCIDMESGSKSML